MECSKSTMSWYFQVDSTGAEPYIHTYPFSPNSSSIQAAIQHWAEFPVLYHRPLLVIPFEYSCVYLSIPKSLTIPFFHLSPRATILSFSLLFMESCVCVLSHVRLFCNAMDCSPLGSSLHGIFQASRLEGVAMPSSRGDFWPRDRIRVSNIRCIDRRVLYH